MDEKDPNSQERGNGSLESHPDSTARMTNLKSFTCSDDSVDDSHCSGSNNVTSLEALCDAVPVAREEPATGQQDQEVADDMNGRQGKNLIRTDYGWDVTHQDQAVKEKNQDYVANTLSGLQDQKAQESSSPSATILIEGIKGENLNGKPSTEVSLLLEDTAATVKDGNGQDNNPCNNKSGITENDQKGKIPPNVEERMEGETFGLKEVSSVEVIASVNHGNDDDNNSNPCKIESLAFDEDFREEGALNIEEGKTTIMDGTAKSKKLVASLDTADTSVKTGNDREQNQYKVESVSEDDEEDQQAAQATTKSHLMDLNLAMEALEHMRRENLVIQFGANVDFECCVQCLFQQKTLDEQLEVKRRQRAKESEERQERRRQEQLEQQQQLDESESSIFATATIPKTTPEWVHDRAFQMEEWWAKRESNRMRKRKATPCFICASPVCSQHCDEEFRSRNINICVDCAPLFSLDFLMECINSPNVQNDDEKRKVQRMLDLYDRALLELKHSSQEFDEIADGLKKNKYVSNRIGLGGSATSMVSGVTGLCATALFLTPLGHTLVLASLALGGVATAISSGNVAMESFSKEHQMADKHIALAAMVNSLLDATNVLREARLTDGSAEENLDDEDDDPKGKAVTKDAPNGNYPAEDDRKPQSKPTTIADAPKEAIEEEDSNKQESAGYSKYRFLRAMGFSSRQQEESGEPFKAKSTPEMDVDNKSEATSNTGHDFEDADCEVAEEQELKNKSEYTKYVWGSGSNASTKLMASFMLLRAAAKKQENATESKNEEQEQKEDSKDSKNEEEADDMQTSTSSRGYFGSRLWSRRNESQQEEKNDADQVVGDESEGSRFRRLWNLRKSSQKDSQADHEKEEGKGQTLRSQLFSVEERFEAKTSFMNGSSSTDANNTEEEESELSDEEIASAFHEATPEEREILLKAPASAIKEYSKCKIRAKSEGLPDESAKVLEPYSQSKAGLFSSKAAQDALEAVKTRATWSRKSPSNDEEEEVKERPLMLLRSSAKSMKEFTKKSFDAAKRRGAARAKAVKSRFAGRKDAGSKQSEETRDLTTAPEYKQYGERMMEKNARFMIKASITLLQEAARFAGGAFSAGILCIEAVQVKQTLLEMKAGNPCEKAKALSYIKNDLNSFPDANSLAEKVGVTSQSTVAKTDGGLSEENVPLMPFEQESL